MARAERCSDRPIRDQVCMRSRGGFSAVSMDAAAWTTRRPRRNRVKKDNMKTSSTNRDKAHAPPYPRTDSRTYILTNDDHDIMTSC
jgi:hypothetical protein